jgi:hypothetical protein
MVGIVACCPEYVCTGFVLAAAVFSLEGSTNKISPKLVSYAVPAGIVLLVLSVLLASMVKQGVGVAEKEFQDWRNDR